MKNKFTTIVTMLVCGLAMAACGGGSGSGLSNNGVLGDLPALFGDIASYKADLQAQSEAWEADIMSGKSTMDKYTEWATKMEKEVKEKEAPFEESVKAAWTKLDGKEIPFTVSDALLFNVEGLKLSADNQSMTATITAKQDLQSGQPGNGWYVYNVLDKDGNVVHPQDIGFADRNYKAGEVIKNGSGCDYTTIPLPVDDAPEKFAEFASIQFVPKK